MAAFESALTCPICRQLFNGPVVLPCGDTFCAACVGDHCERNNECPTCHMPFFPRDSHPSTAVQNIVLQFQAFKARLAGGGHVPLSFWDEEEVSRNEWFRATEEVARKLETCNMLLLHGHKAVEAGRDRAQRDVLGSLDHAQRCDQDGCVLANSGHGPRLEPSPLSPTPHVLLASSLGDRSTDLLKRAVRGLGSAVVHTKWSSEVTHVLTDPIAWGGKLLASRTIKHMLGILSGQWIMSARWLEESLAAGAWLDAAPYEVDGDTSTSGQGGPARGRLARAAGPHGIFSHLEVHLLGKFSKPNPSRAQVVQLLHEGGATISPTWASWQDPLLRPDGAMLICDLTEVPEDVVFKCTRAALPLVNVRWLMDSISHYRALGFDELAEGDTDGGGYRVVAAAAPAFPPTTLAHGGQA